MALKAPDRLDRQVVVGAGWQAFFEATQVPAAVRVGDTLYVTGHTGDAPMGVYDDNPEAQIRQVFANVTETLASAGFTWSDVVEVTTYHVGLRQQAESLMRVSAEFVPEPNPAWTAVGVTELWDAEAIMELSCVAMRRAGTRTHAAER